MNYHWGWSVERLETKTLMKLMKAQKKWTMIHQRLITNLRTNAVGEVEEQHTKKLKTQIHKMKVDREEGDLLSLFRSRRLKRKRYMNLNRTKTKSKTHTKTILNSNLPANQKVWILKVRSSKATMMKLDQMKDTKFS